jgi:hypothetical protein
LLPKLLGGVILFDIGVVDPAEGRALRKKFSSSASPTRQPGWGKAFIITVPSN